MFIITSTKRNIRALNETINNVEYFNKLFETDDCVVTEGADIPYVRPTAEERARAQEIAENKSALSISDYKILKKLEKLLPFDDADVIERQKMRNRINELEAL